MMRIPSPNEPLALSRDDVKESIHSANAKVARQTEPTTGIIPFTPIEIHPREALDGDVAHFVSSALTGPAIGVIELADMIVDMVEEHYDLTAN